MNLDKEKKAEWRKQERQWGIYMPQPVRKVIEDIAGPVCHYGDVEDFKGTLTDFMRLTHAVLQHMANVNKRQSANEPGEATGRKRYQRSFEKRLHLVEFVAEHELTVKSLLEETFAHHTRFNWKQICTDWNEAHPYDPMTPAVLKATYYRAIAQLDIQREYFDGRYNELAEKVWPVATKLAKEFIEAEPSLGMEQGELMATQYLDSWMEEFTVASAWSDYIKELVSLCEQINSMYNSMSDTEKEVPIPLDNK